MELSKRYRFYSTPLFLEFAAGLRDYPCTPWGNVTRTPKGWKGPCYLIGEKYFDTWDAFWNGVDWPYWESRQDHRCQDCLMHSGFEASVVRKLGESRQRHVDNGEVELSRLRRLRSEPATAGHKSPACVATVTRMTPAGCSHRETPTKHAESRVVPFAVDGISVAHANPERGHMAATQALTDALQVIYREATRSPWICLQCLQRSETPVMAGRRQLRARLPVLVLGGFLSHPYYYAPFGRVLGQRGLRRPL